MTQPKQVFLSHASQDEKFVARLADTIRAHGIRVWYSRSHILGGQQWHDEIGEALRQSDWFMIVLSPRSIESMWVKRELLYALQQERFRDKIAPVLHEPCDLEKLSWVLASLQAINFHSSFEDGCRELLRIWGLKHMQSMCSMSDAIFDHETTVRQGKQFASIASPAASPRKLARTLSGTLTGALSGAFINDSEKRDGCPFFSPSIGKSDQAGGSLRPAGRRGFFETRSDSKAPWPGPKRPGRTFPFSGRKGDLC